MKRTLAYLMVLAIAGFSSCSSPNRIPESTILNQVNTSLDEANDNPVTCELAVGKYELNEPEARLSLRQMQEAGLVNYAVTRYAWWEKKLVTETRKVKVYRKFWGSYYEDYDYEKVPTTKYYFRDHYIVDVSLTPKGERLIAQIKDADKVDKDLVEKEVDPSEYNWNKKDLSEDWPVIDNPFLPKKEEKKEEGNQESVTTQTTSAEKPAKKADNAERIELAQYEAYQEVKPQLNKESVLLKAGEWRAVKARNIFIGDVLGRKYAHTEVIFESKNATDFGRIIRGFEDGKKQLKDYFFLYYQDKGWVLDTTFSPSKMF